MAIVLVLLAVISSEHHASGHVDRTSVKHVHASDLQLCTQDHAADAKYAAMSNCPVFTLRHTGDDSAAQPRESGSFSATIDIMSAI